MKCDINLQGELSREKLRDFAQYIIPFIRDFSDSEEGKKYISDWMQRHPEYEEDEDYAYNNIDYDEDDDY